MSIVFTICSINYLAQAKTLGFSLKSTNPCIEFRIYLVDKLLGREDVKQSIPFTLVEIEELKIPSFPEMVRKYDVIELNTSVKPFIIDAIFSEEPAVNNIIYLDPDIKVFHSLEGLYANLMHNAIILTPHSITPSDSHPFGQPEVNYLSTGIFNLGFIALSRREETFKILSWWKEKLIDQGYKDHQRHLFYDQKWMNLAPIFFQKVYIEKSEAYNVAGWNLHERYLSRVASFYYVNGSPLIFYHFSGVEIEGKNVSKYSRYQIIDRPDIAEVLHDYRKEVLENNYLFFKQYECAYQKQAIRTSNDTMQAKASRWVWMSKIRRLMCN